MTERFANCPFVACLVTVVCDSTSPVTFGVWAYLPITCRGVQVPAAATALDLGLCVSSQELQQTQLWGSQAPEPFQHPQYLAGSISQWAPVHAPVVCYMAAACRRGWCT